MIGKFRYSWKQFFFDLHLWLGLASGLIVAVLCLTGFYLAIHPPVEDWLNRDLYRRVDRQPALQLSELLEEVQAEEAAYTAVEIPTDEARPWVLRQGRKSALVEQSSGELLGEPRPFLDGSYRFCFRLHRWLLLESSTGRAITGAATVGFLFILASGLVLWMQKTVKNRRRGLLLKRGVSWKRLNYDTHLVLGLYASLPLFLMGVTGLFWSYRGPFVAIVYRVLDGAPAPARQERKEPKDEAALNYRLPYTEAREYFSSRFPEPGHLTIYFPREGEETFRVVKTRQASLGVLPVRDEARFSVNDGQVMEELWYDNKTRAEKFLSLIKAIHLGEFYGFASILLYLICTAIGTSLPISGTIMWWNRMRGRFRSKSLSSPRREA